MIMSEKLMSNIINSHNLNINNTLNSAQNHFGKKDTAFSAVYAPVSLPKFSFEKEIEEKDEYRKQINFEIYNQKKKEERKPNRTKILIAALAGAILFLFGRKK